MDNNSILELTEPNNVNNNTAAGTLAGGITVNGTAAMHARISTDFAGETFTIAAIIGVIASGRNVKFTKRRRAQRICAA